MCDDRPPADDGALRWFYGGTAPAATGHSRRDTIVVRAGETAAPGRRRSPAAAPRPAPSIRPLRQLPAPW